MKEYNLLPSLIFCSEKISNKKNVIIYTIGYALYIKSIMPKYILF